MTADPRARVSGTADRAPVPVASADRAPVPAATADPRPVLFVTNHAPAFRVGAFAALHAAERVTFALIGGGVRHGGGPGEAAGLPFPVVRCSPRRVHLLAASGRYRAVVAGLSGRLAPAAAYGGARRAGIPFVLWATMWAHPRTPAHALTYLPVRHLYRHADAVVTYGPHVSAYVRGKGAGRAVVEAPQSVDNAYWSAPAAARRHAPFQVLFAGRLAREKGIEVLRDAWPASGLPQLGAALAVAGDGPLRASLAALGAVAPGSCSAGELRSLYAGSDVVVLPSIRTREFLEPWGLTVNEAFNRALPVIATPVVGAVAGGLVRDEETGLVVPAGDASALAAALRRLHADADLRAALGRRGREEVQAYSHQAWSAGVSRALAAVGAASAVVA